MSLRCEICKCIPPRVVGVDVTRKHLKFGENPSTSVVSSLINLLVSGDEHNLSECAILDGRTQSTTDFEDFKQELKWELIEKGNGIKIKKSNLNVINAEEFAKGSKMLLGKRKHGANTSINQRKNLVIDTVRKFKGLEAKIVFLLLKEGDGDDYKNIAYVGMSRAISLLYVFYC